MRLGRVMQSKLLNLIAFRSRLQVGEDGGGHVREAVGDHDDGVLASEGGRRWPRDRATKTRK